MRISDWSSDVCSSDLCGCHVFWLTHARRQDLLHEGLKVRLPGVGERLRHDQSRRDGVATDTLCGMLGRDIFGERHHAPFGRAICNPRDIPDESRSRGGIDDRAAAAANYMRNSQAASRKIGAKIDSNFLFQKFEQEVGELFITRQTCPHTPPIL